MTCIDTVNALHTYMLTGIGVDITEIKRIKQAVSQYKRTFILRSNATENGFLRRIFTPEEIRYCIKRKKNPYQHFAARFAAKEAFMKAIGTGWGSRQAPAWKEIEIKKSPRTPPLLVLSGRAKKICDQLKVKKILLSLSHTTDYAVAFVIMEM